MTRFLLLLLLAATGVAIAAAPGGGDGRRVREHRHAADALCAATPVPQAQVSDSSVALSVGATGDDCRGGRVVSWEIAVGNGRFEAIAGSGASATVPRGEHGTRYRPVIAVGEDTVRGREVHVAGSAPSSPAARVVDAPPLKYQRHVKHLRDGREDRDAQDVCAQDFDLTVTGEQSAAPRKVGVTFTRGHQQPCLAQQRTFSFEIARDGGEFVPVASAPFVRDAQTGQGDGVAQMVFTLTEAGSYAVRARVDDDGRTVLVGPVSVRAD